MEKIKSSIFIRKDHLEEMDRIKKEWKLSYTDQVDEAYQYYLDNFNQIMQKKLSN